MTKTSTILLLLSSQNFFVTKKCSDLHLNIYQFIVLKYYVIFSEGKTSVHSHVLYETTAGIFNHLPKNKESCYKFISSYIHFFFYILGANKI